MHIRELLLQIRQQPSDRAVQRATGMHRKTVKRYRAWDTEQNLIEDPLPALGELEKWVQQTMPEPPPPQNLSSLDPYGPLVSQLRKQGAEDDPGGRSWRRHSLVARWWHRQNWR